MFGWGRSPVDPSTPGNRKQVPIVADTTSSTPSSDESAKVVELLRDERFAMITTIAADGGLQARPMAIQKVADDGDMWFFIARSSDQAQTVQAEPRLNVAVSTKDTWISVAGRGEIVRDQALIEELWNSWVEAWFTDGPSDPDVALLHVDADSAEYWDSPGGRVASLISFVKAKATGKPYEGDNAATEMP